MKGREDTYRLRVGGYRVIFVADSTNKIINVNKIGTRSKIEKHY